jgi:methyl-accepting chemotaxis protein
MAAMVTSMGKIKETSSNVAEVIGVINHIVSQTKLLSLRASNEAVRTGEAGKGFAVVANEVREFTNRSSQASGTKLINDSMSEVEKVVTNADQTASVLENIDAIVQEVNGLVEQISEYSSEQTSSIEGINQGLPT